jgi:hypothetical protein
VVDGRWNIVAQNNALSVLTDGVAPEFLQPPANALRIALHPDGMAPRSPISASGAPTCCSNYAAGWQSPLTANSRPSKRS